MKVVQRGNGSLLSGRYYNKTWIAAAQDIVANFVALGACMAGL
jgi:hypothetical protein